MKHRLEGATVLKGVFGLLTYLLTAIATGYQLFWLGMWGVWGRVASPFEFIGFIGAFGLAIAAFETRLRSRRFGAWFALPSVGMFWLFYAPATLHTLRSVSSNNPLSPFTLLPSSLLLLATLLAIGTILEKKPTN